MQAVGKGLTAVCVSDNLPLVGTYETVLEALGDRTRRAIIDELATGAAPVQHLAEQLPVSRPAVSQHLRVLLDAGLVAFEPDGTRNVYRLERTGFDELRGWLDDFWTEVLGSFEAHARRSFTEKGTRSDARTKRN